MAKPKDADAYVEALEPPVREIAEALRTLVRATAPKLEERIKYSFPHYDLNGTVVYIMATRDHVDLGFYDGVDLKDPKKMLEGTGKRLRHVKVYAPENARSPALAALVREAVRFREATGAPPKGWR